MNRNLREMSYSDELPAASSTRAMNHRSVVPLAKGKMKVRVGKTKESAHKP
jgi:hypothetical protein